MYPDVQIRLGVGGSGLEIGRLRKRLAPVGLVHHILYAPFSTGVVITRLECIFMMFFSMSLEGVDFSASKP